MSSPLGKKVAKNSGRKAINNRYKWVEFVAQEEDADGNSTDYIIRCNVRTSLTNAEIEKLTGLSGADDELWVAVAPCVREWDVIWFDGESLYEVMPPAEVGPEAFKYAPPQLAWAILNALTSEPFTKIDPKRSTPAESTE